MLAGFRYMSSRSLQRLQVPAHWPRADSRRMDRPAVGGPREGKAVSCRNVSRAILIAVLQTAPEATDARGMPTNTGLRDRQGTTRLRCGVGQTYLRSAGQARFRFQWTEPDRH